METRPVLVISKGSVDYQPRFDNSVTLSPRAFKEGQLKSLKVLTEDLKLHSVAEVIRVTRRGVGLLSWFTIVGRHLICEVKLDEGQSITLDEAKQIVLTEFYEGSYWNDNGLAKARKKRAENAKSASVLFRTLKDPFGEPSWRSPQKSKSDAK